MNDKTNAHICGWCYVTNHANTTSLRVTTTTRTSPILGFRTMLNYNRAYK